MSAFKGDMVSGDRSGKDGRPAEEKAPLGVVDDLWRFRSVREDDFNFIIATWIRGARDHGVMRMCPRNLYFERMQQLIVLLMEDCVTVVACDPKVDSLIYGYIVGLPADIAQGPGGVAMQVRPPVVHWTFVRTDFQQKGLGKLLLRELGYTRGAGFKFTLPFEKSRFILPRFPDAEFDPFWLMGLQGKSYVEG